MSKGSARRRENTALVEARLEMGEDMSDLKELAEHLRKGNWYLRALDKLLGDIDE